MGLKTTNYMIKETNHLLSTAYAKIHKIVAEENGLTYAEFYIQKDRDDAINCTPFEIINFHFSLNTKENPYVTAYREATEKVCLGEIENSEGVIETIYQENPFYGWENDIIE